jgi:hypothetical protein
MMQVRMAHPSERAFLVEMARLACAMEEHPLTAADVPEVRVDDLANVALVLMRATRLRCNRRRLDGQGAHVGQAF